MREPTPLYDLQEIARITCERDIVDQMDDKRSTTSQRPVTLNDLPSRADLAQTEYSRRCLDQRWSRTLEWLVEQSRSPGMEDLVREHDLGRSTDQVELVESQRSNEQHRSMMSYGSQGWLKGGEPRSNDRAPSPHPARSTNRRRSSPPVLSIARRTGHKNEKRPIRLGLGNTSTKDQERGSVLSGPFLRHGPPATVEILSSRDLASRGRVSDSCEREVTRG